MLLATFIIHTWEMLACPGSLLLLMSLILSRGIQASESDCDELSPLITERFGHAAQEVVSLGLIGRASANVFDGEMDIGGVMAKVTLLPCARSPHSRSWYTLVLNDNALTCELGCREFPKRLRSGILHCWKPLATAKSVQT